MNAGGHWRVNNARRDIFRRCSPWHRAYRHGGKRVLQAERDDYRSVNLGHAGSLKRPHAARLTARQRRTFGQVYVRSRAVVFETTRAMSHAFEYSQNRRRQIVQGSGIYSTPAV